MITHPDGTESVEKIDQATDLIERSVRLMNTLRDDGWDEDGQAGAGDRAGGALAAAPHPAAAARGRNASGKAGDGAEREKQDEGRGVRKRHEDSPGRCTEAERSRL